MWDMINDLMPRKRRNGMNTVTALVIGAGVGIAAWEVMRRNNVAGGSIDNMGGMNDIARTMMVAINQD
ncbi:MAG: hypothetical protein WCC10_04555 [Tumebacillaceae bacterium]